MLIIDEHAGTYEDFVRISHEGALGKAVVEVFEAEQYLIIKEKPRGLRYMVFVKAETLPALIDMLQEAANRFQKG